MHTLLVIFEWIAVVVDIVGVAILMVAAVRFVVQWLSYEVRRLGGRAGRDGLTALRVDLGAYILVALEFLIVGDIVHSAISQTFEDFGLLGLLVIIRILLSYFLGRELKEAERAAEAPEVASTPSSEGAEAGER